MTDKMNICRKCGRKLTSQGTVDDHWRFYKPCVCGYEQVSLVGNMIPHMEMKLVIKREESHADR